MKKNQTTDMVTGSPGKSLFFFALPMILGNLFQQFYNMTDSIIVGQFVGEEALAAVGASYALTTVFIMIAIGGGIGASVITSQYLGAKEYGNMKTSVSTALITFLTVSILLSGFGLTMNGAILRGLHTPENILGDAMVYLKIYFLGLPFLFMYNILASIFNATGDSRTPLYLLIFSSLLNVALDLAAVTWFHMGVAGVAVATVAAQGISAVISAALLMKRLKKYPSEDNFRFFDWKMLSSATRVALPSILQQSIVSIGMLLVQSVVNGFGSSVVAGYSAASRVESFCIVPMIASGNAMSTFTAQNIGAKKPERVKEGFRAGVKMVAAFAVVICVVLSLFHEEIVSAFLDVEGNSLAFRTGVSYVSFIGFFFVFIGLKAVIDGVLRGSGDMVVFTIANLVNLSLRVSVASRFAPVFGVEAVWYAIPMGWAANALISYLRYLSGKWSQKRLIG